MKSNYKQLGEIIHWCDERNRNAETSEVLGVSIGKEYMPSVANIIGTDLSNYKLVRKYRFACNPMHVGRDKVLPIALYSKETPAIVSPAYFTFEIINKDKVLPEYLMLLFSTPIFDKNCWFRTDGSVRGGISWDDLCRVELLVPDLKQQKKIIEYFTLLNSRIATIKKLRQALCCFVDTLYRKRFSTNEEWQLGVLGDIVTMQRGHDLPKHSIIKGKYPVAASSYTIAYHNEFTCEAPCIVMGRSGNIANPRLYLERCWAHNTALFSKSFPNNSNPIWVYYALRSIEYSQFEGKGSAVPTLNRNDLHASPLRIPPKNIQDEFCRLAMPCLRMVAKIEKENKQLSEIRSCILSKVISNNL